MDLAVTSDDSVKLSGHAIDGVAAGKREIFHDPVSA
jgi:hypothetical protein